MTSIQNWPIWSQFLDKRDETRHLGVINLHPLEYSGKKSSRLTMMTSAPPSSGGRSGPPGESQYLFALSSIHSVKVFLSSTLIHSPGLLTPWRILWTVLVIRNTPGFGFGTYLGYKLATIAFKLRRSFIPSQVNSNKSRKSYESMSHQSNSATLWCATEECYLCSFVFQHCREFHHGSPCRGTACSLEVLGGQ